MDFATDAERRTNVDANRIGPGRAAQTSGVTSQSDFWSNFDIVHCTDGKQRRFEPGSFPLANGIPARVGLLRGYGNAIVPQVAAIFIRAFLAAE
jgi:DNA (cytosine-5)-methyltransferase 1